MKLGTTTSTDDPTGEVTGHYTGWKTLTDREIADALARFEGRYQQRPPVFSAKKVRGVRAHRLARKGQEPALPTSEVDVHRLTMLERDGAGVRFEAEVGSGTYIRAIARDVGQALGCGAHLSVLRRTAVGPFNVEDAVTLDDLSEGSVKLRPPREAVRHLPILEVDGSVREKVVHGQPLSGESVVEGPVALVAGGELLAIAESDGSVLKPRVVLAG
jgi:tRNA pseudouridine55 synthase